MHKDEAEGLKEEYTGIKLGYCIRHSGALVCLKLIWQGPNFLWHCDGYDKLKPYGLCIHGCIDGSV